MRQQVRVWTEVSTDVVVVLSRAQAQELLAHAASGAWSTKSDAERGDRDAARRLPVLKLGMRALDVALNGEDRAPAAGQR